MSTLAKCWVCGEDVAKTEEHNVAGYLVCADCFPVAPSKLQGEVLRFLRQERVEQLSRVLLYHHDHHEWPHPKGVSE